MSAEEVPNGDDSTEEEEIPELNLQELLLCVDDTFLPQSLPREERMIALGDTYRMIVASEKQFISNRVATYGSTVLMGRERVPRERDVVTWLPHEHFYGDADLRGGNEYKELREEGVLAIVEQARGVKLRSVNSDGIPEIDFQTHRYTIKRRDESEAGLPPHVDMASVSAELPPVKYGGSTDSEGKREKELALVGV